jgi:hypothetical protein
MIHKVCFVSLCLQNVNKQYYKQNKHTTLFLVLVRMSPPSFWNTKPRSPPSFSSIGLRMAEKFLFSSVPNNNRQTTDRHELQKAGKTIDRCDLWSQRTKTLQKKKLFGTSCCRLPLGIANHTGREWEAWRVGHTHWKMIFSLQFSDWPRSSCISCARTIIINGNQ